MKKRFVIAVILSLIICILSGCGISDKNAYKSQGKKNAVKYIEEKYGFKPSVKSVEAIKYNGSPIAFSASSYTGYVYVKMEHDNKTFYVHLSATSKNTDGVDNYQVDVIEDAIEKKLNEMVDNIIHIDYCIGTSKEDSSDPYYGMIPLKYDGNNLNEVLESAQLKRIVVSLAESDLNVLTEEMINEVFGSKTDILFVNYKSMEDYQKAENTTYGLRDYRISSGIEKNDAYIVDYIQF